MMARGHLPNPRELFAFCPGCHTFETLWFGDDQMRLTRRFVQVKGRVFHDCGTKQPCRLLGTGGKREQKAERITEAMGRGVRPTGDPRGR